MSCFCTAQGRVIHAVSGPVSKSKLLEEAKWAVDVYQQMLDKQIKDHSQQAEFVRAAHLAKFGVRPDEFKRVASDQMEVAWREYQSRMNEYQARVKEHQARVETYGAASEAGTYIRPVPSLDILARRHAAKLLDRGPDHGHRSDRAHQIFAAEPLASIVDIEARVFEELTDERFIHNRNRVYNAAEGVELAKEQRRPLVFVFYKETHGGRYGDQRQPNEAAQLIMNDIRARRRKSKIMRNAVFISLPIREQAALTQLVDIPVYELDESSSGSVAVVVADPDGKQVVAEGGRINFANVSSGFRAVSSQAAEQRRELASNNFN